MLRHIGGKFQSNMAASSRKRYHILLSSFNSEEKAKLSQSIQELGGTYLDTPHFVRSCSHVICGKPSRGEKFLCGCASGKWILKREFIADSVKAGKWLEEKLYEWNEQSTVEGVSTSHMSSPARWRRILQQKRGPFQGWKALVAVTDAKKRAAYKRLLEVGCAMLVSGKPPYPASLASKLTHVFVEKALEEDVQALQNAGVQCLCPDYIPECILQDPTPVPAAFFITAYKSPVNLPVAVGRFQRTAGKLKNTPVLDSTQSRIGIVNNVHAISASKKTKAPCEPSCTAESPNKKRKQYQKSSVDFTCVDRWMPVSTLNTFVSSKSKVSADEFPGYIVDSIDGYLEESHQSTVLDVIQSFMTSKRYPTPSLLRIITDILLKSPSRAQATKAFVLLQRLLVLHPPTDNTSLYQSILGLHTGVGETAVEEIGCEWEFLKTICSKTDQNSLLLLRFVITLLERDFHERTSNSMLSASDKLQSLKQCLLWRMFWPGSSPVSFNTRLRELFRITWSAACCACDDPTQILILQSLQSVVTMTSQCYILSDLVSMKCTEVGLGTRLSERSRTFVTELACEGTHREATMKRFLETCSTWLRMHVADMLLANYTDHLVPLERRHLKNKALSLEKIVSYYFFLVPRTSVDITSTAPVKNTRRRGTPLQDIGSDSIRNGIRNSVNVVSGINRRNIKGETKLHVACIKDDAVKVKQLLAAGADANSTDHAGWTPLHEACNHGHVKCVQELLKARQLVYEINPGDDTCRVLNMLAAPKCGTTPLHDAVCNNHLQVVELLVTGGGLPVLQAKNACGVKPVDMEKNKKIKEFLQTMESKNAVSSIRPFEEPDQTVSKHSTQECEEFLLILSHLVQAYFRVTGTPTDNSLWMNFTAHVDNLESRVTRMLPDSHLSSVLSIRFAAMKMLATVL